MQKPLLADVLRPGAVWRAGGLHNQMHVTASMPKTLARRVLNSFFLPPVITVASCSCSDLLCLGEPS